MKRFNEAYECIQTNAHILEKELQSNMQDSRACFAGQPKKPQRSNFDWILDLRVSEEDMKDQDSHPNSPNNQFSHLDDLTLYRSVMMGNTSLQVARSFGCSEREIISRVQSTQFKRRIRLARKMEKDGKRPYRKYK
ncbi:chaperone DnaJ [Perkinsela sp. CCAP 1560/4]|nr:chaperone DnaJ [Perkinsela sp. CCAP 1560/4]|eukprot:KNH07617.1 chaperone DnaJ [Perkinsela sp. CCAP 1560/4]